MRHHAPVFRFADMPVSIHPSAVIGSLILLIVLALAAWQLTALSFAEALIAAFIGVLLHWLGVLVHNYGHFAGAKRIGYPSTGLLLRLIFGRIDYPEDEGALTPEIHIRRALTGPLVSLIFAVVLAPVVLLWLIPSGEVGRFLGFWMLLDYAVVLTIGALLPPIWFDWFTNDGGTIVTVIQQRRRSQPES